MTAVNLVGVARGEEKYPQPFEFGMGDDQQGRNQVQYLDGSDIYPKLATCRP